METILTLLTEKRIDPNQVSIIGDTPLYIAIQNGHLKIVQTLLEYGADPNQANFKGVTPLFKAAQKGHLEIVKVLLAHKEIKPDQVNENGSTQLFIAAYEGHLDVVKVLLKNGSNPNKIDNYGDTPLIFATVKGRREVLETLLENGADPNQANDDFETPLFIAAKENKLEMVKCLLHLENIDINKPSQSTQEQLKGFVSQKTNDVIERMNEHIEQYQQKYPDKTMIEVTPEEIAMILGHKDILEVFKQFSVLHQKADKTTTTPTFGR